MSVPKLQAGKFYRSKKGEIVGPIRPHVGTNDDLYCFIGKCGGLDEYFTALGSYKFGDPSVHDLLTHHAFDTLGQATDAAMAQPAKAVPEAPPAPPPWKDISIYEDEFLVIPLADVQHLEKMRDGSLWVITCHTKLDKSDTAFPVWHNPVVLPASFTAAMMTQFIAYRKFIEAPQVIIQEAPRVIRRTPSKSPFTKGKQ